MRRGRVGRHRLLGRLDGLGVLLHLRLVLLDGRGLRLDLRGLLLHRGRLLGRLLLLLRLARLELLDLGRERLVLRHQCVGIVESRDGWRRGRMDILPQDVARFCIDLSLYSAESPEEGEEPA